MLIAAANLLIISQFPKNFVTLLQFLVFSLSSHNYYLCPHILHSNTILLRRIIRLLRI